MNGDIFIVLIVAIVMIASVMKAGIKHGAGRNAPFFHFHNEEGGDPKLKAETIRLHDEVVQLKERIKVLERIAIEKENSLAKEIEELRNR
jgi:hypothetical protein